MLLINRLIPFAILMSPADDLSGADAGGGENPPAAKTPIVKVDTTPAGFSQADLDAAVAKAVAANNTSRDEHEKGLKETKDSLLEQNKKHKEKIRDNELKQRMIDGDVEKVTKEIEARIKKENLEKLGEQQTEIENLKKASHNKSIESFVSEINDGCNIMSELREARALQILKNSEFTTDENGNTLIDGKNQQEFISDWLENGQNVDTWRSAKPSSGGGAKGGKSPAGTLNTAETLSKLSGGEMFAAASEMMNK